MYTHIYKMAIMIVITAVYRLYSFHVSGQMNWKYEIVYDNYDVVWQKGYCCVNTMWI